VEGGAEDDDGDDDPLQKRSFFEELWVILNDMYTENELRPIESTQVADSTDL
jgi:hypothetical protein